MDLVELGAALGGTVVAFDMVEFGGDQNRNTFDTLVVDGLSFYGGKLVTNNLVSAGASQYYSEAAGDALGAFAGIGDLLPGGSTVSVPPCP